MLVSDFDFNLPEELIAQQPLPERDASRMLVLDRHTGAFRDDSFRSLPSLLQPGDLLVLNNSRVIPARLHGNGLLLFVLERRFGSGRHLSLPTSFRPK